MIRIVATNVSTVVTDAQVQDCCAAVQVQANTEFANEWGTDDNVSIVLLPKGTLPPDCWQMVFADDSDQADALGYHELNAEGGPIGYVFAKTTQQDGGNWTITASHEFLEMLADPWINRACEVESGGRSTFYMQEVCDACEDDSYGYPIALSSGVSIMVSDFVTPAWFIPGEPGPYDFKGHVSKPLEILTNGYIADFAAGSTSWNEVLGSLQGRLASSVLPRPLHRRHRRLMGRSKWRRSETP